MKINMLLRVLALVYFLGGYGIGQTQDIQWTSSEIDLGDVKVMEDKSCSFTFLNTTSSPLVVETVRTSCGCTEPQWPHEPVLPGQTGQIAITFTPNRAGYHRKKIKVFFAGVRKGSNLWIEAEAK
ncbi:MAG TPA: DUF1573 domain-containing protein [Saprospiraceae bacterium]|nr:DUF1573 domain-containing protein [Saprospiraceae bacterium]